ncbi:MAG: hypothetical protein ACREQ2_21565 [Candidatus Binatia bacterium]
MTALILAVYVVLLTHPINLTVGDLGRHLKNGELFLQSGLLAKVNLYSYTQPDYPFINHHWGAGVIFYLIERSAGLKGLSLVFIAISAATLQLFLNIAAKLSSFPIAAIATVICMPILITRHEIRPEAFTYFLSALFLQFLWRYKLRKLGFRALFILPLLQIFWVNLHIYFFIGIILIGVFLFESLVASFTDQSPELRTRSKQLAIILLLTLMASCVNPAGVSGALYPLFILHGYEFPVLENYSVPAVLRSSFTFLPLTYFLIILGMLGLSWVYVFARDRARVSYANLLLSLMVVAMAWNSIRNFGLFAFFALPLTAANLEKFLAGDGARSYWTAGKTAMASAAIAILLFVISPVYFLGGGRGVFGIGLKQGSQAAGDFIRRENLRGPIFNNFDIGGYLTYHLYPQERVFVDNRPEAYPAAFFRDDYFPLLQSEGDWMRRSTKFGFNMIIFNHRDRSVASEQFIVRRVLDPAWAPVFFDREIIVLVKRHASNQATIDKHELSREQILSKSN